MGLSPYMDEKNKNWREKNCDSITLKSAVTKADTKSSIPYSPEHKAPRSTFIDDVAFSKGDTRDEFFSDIPELNTRELDNYDSFSISSAVVPFGPKYIHATKNHLISSSLSITTIVPAAYTIDFLVCYFINGLSGRNCTVDIKKLRKFFLFKPETIVMKTLEATT